MSFLKDQPAPSDARIVDASIAHSTAAPHIQPRLSWRSLWQPLIFAATLLFIALWLRSQWPALRAYPWRLDGRWLALSTALLLATWSLEVAIWRRLLAVLSRPVPYATAWRIWFLSTLTRYIPGNVWQPLTMTLHCRRLGIAPEATVASMVLYLAVSMLAVVPIGAGYFLWSGNWGLFDVVLGEGVERGVLILLAAALLPVLLFAARPGWLLGVINWALRRVGRPVLTVKLRAIEFVALLGASIAAWLCWGGSFAALTFALGDFARGDLLALAPHLIAVYAVAYLIGYASFITPSGLGVREGAIYLLLVPLLDGGLVTVAALAMRVLNTLAEVVTAGVALAWSEKTSDD